MNEARLAELANAFGTPLYVYDRRLILARLRLLKELTDGRFGISYAIKANPNAALLRALRPELSTFDASSYGEVERALAAGMPARRISFSGPGKRDGEVARAVAVGVGELIVENLGEARRASALAIAAGRRQSVLVRLNPKKVPRGFGASMGGTVSQFGIDEEEMTGVLPAVQALRGLEVNGFHAYSGTNALAVEPIGENFAIFADLFRAAQSITGCRPRRCVFGAGFGVPYLPGEAPLDHDGLPDAILPVVDALAAEDAFADAAYELELGRWLVAPAGWLLTSIVAAKHSRGTEVRICDAGFNNHLAACGMMGSVIRRNWVFENVTNPDGPVHSYLLVGPLCTSIDRLAHNITLPEARVGDVLAIPQSGAYGLTASPTRFISHPEPREVMLDGDVVTDVSESLLNHWPAEPQSAGATSG